MYQHPLIKYLKSYSDVDVALSSINSNILYKRQGDLVIFKYNNQNGTDLERSCRGLIYNTQTDKIVCYSNEGTYDFETFTNKVPYKQCVIEENLEGSLINLYFNNQRWNVSTKFCINADESRFRSKKTFRQIFDHLFKINTSELDKKYTYSFLIRIPENRLVTNITDYDLYHIETQNNITGEKIYMDIGVKHPVVLKIRVKSYKKLYNKLSNLDWEDRGYMLYSKDRLYRCSLINPAYKKILNLVNTNEDLKYTMLESSLYTYKTDIILEHFPEYNTIMTGVLNDVKLLQQYIFSAYVEIFCKKNKTIDDFNEKYKSVLEDTHNLYKLTRRHDITFEILPEDIFDMIIQNDCLFVYKLLYK